MVVTPNAAAARACRYLTRVAGNKQLSGYVRADATKLRDILVENGLAGSCVARLFTTVKSIFNFACVEAGLEIKNPFAGLYLDRGQGVSVRKPIPVPVIKRVQAECVRSDDPLRWAAALLSDTSMRLAEVIGLAISDIHLDCVTSFIDLTPHPWRRLKTESSTRKVSLAGAALWAATRICDRGLRGFHWADIELPDTELKQIDGSGLHFPEALYNKRTVRRSLSSVSFEKGGRFFGGWR